MSEECAIAETGTFLREGTFEGQVAVVTGGGTGLGIEVSRGLARLGARVVIASRDPEHHHEFLDDVRKNGWLGHAGVLDVREASVVRGFMKKVAAEHGRLDILVNNAAGNFVRPALALPSKGWQAVIDIALSGVFYCSQGAGLVMREQQRGVIANVVAPYAWTGCPGVVHSVCAKAGVLAMTRTLAVEWAEHGIRVNAVSPGPFQSEGAASRLWPSEEIEEAIREDIPMKRFGDTREVADAILYLLSPAARYVTGACLTIDGGWKLGKGLTGDTVEAVERRRS
jgi:NAD(P)-dependent dehydrogenase (short-subunit alcohol dehydrogenase family)